MRVSVFGLGYVGCVSAASFAGDGHDVVGVDVNADKVASINAGRSPIVEPGLDELLARSASPKGACARPPTPRTRFATPTSRCSASARRAGRTAASTSRISSASASRSARALRDKPDYHVVVVRSTVLPGTTHDVVIPALERESGKKYGDGFGVSVNPEFLREGTALKDFRKPPLTLVGHNHAADASGTIALYQAIDAPLISTSIRVAEMMKYTSNTWHALKVVLRERDRQPVQEARRRQPRGDGHLLPRREAEPVAVLPQAGLRVRRIVPAEGRARAAVSRQGSRRRAAADLADPAEQQGCRSSRRSTRCSRPARRTIGLLGFSFKAGTDDLRESPIVILAEALLGKGVSLKIYDKNVSLAQAGRRQQGLHREADPAPLVAALQHDRRSRSTAPR